MSTKTFGSYLAGLRREKKLTQKEVADHLYVSDKTVSRWETDRSLPELSLIPALADLLEVSADELLRNGLSQTDEEPQEDVATNVMAENVARVACRKFNRNGLVAMLIFLIVPKIVDISFGSTTSIVLQVMFVTFLFACVCIAIGLAISRFAKNNSTVGAVVSLVNFPVLMLGGCMWPKEIMPEAIQKIGSFMPSDWFLTAAKTALNGEGLGAAIKEIGLMVGLVAVLLIISFVIKTDDNQ